MDLIQKICIAESVKARLDLITQRQAMKQSIRAELNPATATRHELEMLKELFKIDGFKIQAGKGD